MTLDVIRSTKFWSNMTKKDISANCYQKRLNVPQYELNSFVTMEIYWIPVFSNNKGFSGHLWHSILIIC